MMRSLLVRFVVACIVIATSGVAVQAQQPARGGERPGDERRVALVIGNGHYEYAGVLPNPTNDAQAMGDALRELGFEVHIGLDLTKDEMDTLLRQYTRALDGANVGLFFYAGHGLQVDGINYILPVDAALERASELVWEAVSVDIVLSQFDRPDFTGLVFLDACRDNPLARSMNTGTRSVGRGLAEVQSATGTLIAYATQPGNVAYDGDEDHSPFTTALLNHIATPGLEVRLMFDLVGEDVAEMTHGLQQPWVHFSRLHGGFYFNPEPQTVADTTGGQTGGNGEEFAANDNDPAVRFYEYASGLENLEQKLLMLEQFIRLYPTHPLAVLAAADVQALRAEAERAALPNPDRLDPTPGRENQPPTVEGDRTLTVDADAGSTRLGIGAPEDEDGDELVVTLLELPTAGEVQSAGAALVVGDVITPGELTGLDYVPDPAVEGAVGAVRYRVEDGNGGAAEGILRIALRAPNRPPVVQEVAQLTLEQSEEPLPLNIIAPIDPDNDRLTITITWLPRAGAVELSGRPVSRGDQLTAFQLIALTYRTDPERVGDMGSFEYEVDDGRGGLVRAALRIGVARPNNLPVVADAERVELGVDPAGVPLGVTLPSDPDGDPLTIRVTWTPRWGSVMNGDRVVERGDELTLAEFGLLRYVAAAGNDGDAGSFEFSVSDGRGEPVRGMVRISVVAPNTAPEVVADQAVTVRAEDGAAPLSFQPPRDADGDALTVTVTEVPFRGRLMADGRLLRVGDTIDGSAAARLVYEPAVGHTGAAGQVAMTVSDGESGEQVAVVRISVESSNRTPIAGAGEELWVLPNVLTPLGISAPTDPDGDPLTIRVLRVPDGGQLRLGSSVIRVGQTLAPAQLASIGFEMTGTVDGGVFAYEADDGRGGLAVGSVVLFAEEAQVIAGQPGEDLAGDALETAYDLGTVTGGTLIIEDTIDESDIGDVFRIEFTDWADVRLTLAGLSGDLDLALRTVDAVAAGRSSFGDLADETIVETVPPGAYLIEVLGYDGAASSYQLTVSTLPGVPGPADGIGETADTAERLALSIGGGPVTMAERVDVEDPQDWYVFEVPTHAEVAIHLTGLTNDLDIELLDGSEIILVASTEYATSDETIVATIEPGIYYVRVLNFDGQSDYELSAELAAAGAMPADNAGNTFDQAADLGLVQGAISFGDWVGLADGDDFIAFEVASRGTLTLHLGGLAGDSDLELLNANGEMLEVSNNTDVVDEEIVIDLQPGRYVAHVYRYTGETDYRLDISFAEGGSTGPNGTTGTNAGPGPDASASLPVLSLPDLQAWENSWSRDERMTVQRALQILGYYNAGIDGVLGSGSRRAISAFQEAIGQPVTGYLSYHDRVELALAAADEAAARAEAAANNARAAVDAPNAEEEISESGNAYRGDRNREGYGIYEWVDGHRYEGQWNVARQGFGILTLANGWQFMGQWNDSTFIGFGVASGPNGEFMAGEWNVPSGTSMLDGLNGYGRIYGADGSVELGYFDDSTLQPWDR